MTFLEMKYLDNLKGINDYFNLAFEKYSNDEIKNELEQSGAVFEELDEQNVTGTGSSFSGGNSGTGPFATKNAFQKGKSIKRKEMFEQDEEENEEVDNIDIERVQQLFSKSINKEGEWMKILELLVDHSKEIPGLSDLDVKNSLIQSVKDI